MVKIVFGGGAVNVGRAFGTLDDVNKVLDILEVGGIKNIDSAQIYGDSEVLLGQTQAASRFTIDTKHCGGWISGQSSADTVFARGKESLKRLQTDQVDIFYLHAPDRDTPLKDTLSGIDQLYQAGAFKRFGLSNFTADEVEEVVSVAKSNNFVVPTVYQGSYSPITRKQETKLFPSLRKHGIAFYAYSPLAGGFLTKSKDQLLEGGKGRWDPSTNVGKLYHSLYKKPLLLEALSLWEQISSESGIPRAELAYRWVSYHSILEDQHGDAIIFSASSFDQLKQTIAALKSGPLSEDVVKKIEAVWKTVESESPLDNFNTSL